jgi:hypothetical protein
MIPMIFYADAEGEVTSVPETVVEPEQAPAPAPPPVATPPVVEKVRPPASVRFDGGYAPRTLFTLPVTGADFGLAVGAQPKEAFAFWGSARGFIGSTENGLHTFDARLLFELDLLPHERLRIGLGFGGFLLGVTRAARDETIRTWGPVFEASLRFDAVRADSYAIFVRAAETVGYDFYDSSAWIGPSIGAGVELDFAGSRPSLYQPAPVTSRTGSAAAPTSAGSP